jgi:K+-sensing histidine kinase KdpD
MAANLIDNAIRYNLPGGSIEVRTEIRYGHALLTVTNTGSHVPADKVDQLFRPFQRLPADGATHPDGHGLGLSIVAAIANAHGARLDARPDPGGGLAVEVLFPHATGNVRGHQDPAAVWPTTLPGMASVMVRRPGREPDVVVDQPGAEPQIRGGEIDGHPN